MKILHYLFFVVTLVFTTSTLSQELTKKAIAIPDIPGYHVLKCDFHMHTVFSDGQVWPTQRIEEAWQDGLDAIAITDHIEYRPHKEFVKGDHNAAYTIALDKSKKMGITLIHGCEITRKMPPGHLNALFISDANTLAIDSFRLAVEEVKKQGGILFWNHPGWVNQQPDGIAKWLDEHTWIYNTGILKGLEIVNEQTYYPEVHQWCLDRNITMVGNSDIHLPTSMYYNRAEGNHRTITLVFAKENTTEALKEAIMDGRTAVWNGTTVYGKERYLTELFKSAVVCKNNSITATPKEWLQSEICNNSDLTFTMQIAKKVEGYNFPESFTLKPGETMLFSFRNASTTPDTGKEITAVYNIMNMFPAPGKTLQVQLTFNIVTKGK